MRNAQQSAAGGKKLEAEKRPRPEGNEKKPWQARVGLDALARIGTSTENSMRTVSFPFSSFSLLAPHWPPVSPELDVAPLHWHPTPLITSHAAAIRCFVLGMHSPPSWIMRGRHAASSRFPVAFHVLMP
jgi:hypothetical protein